MRKEDAAETAIPNGINRIYALYVEAKISRKAALRRLSAFLDSKGKIEHDLAALAIIKNWRR